MGLSVILQDEHGKPLEAAISDPTNTLHRLLPSHDDHTSNCIRFIDWYGDTVFNYLQMEIFLAEWQKLYSAIKSENEKELLTKIEKLAKQCRAKRFYLKFYGD